VIGSNSFNILGCLGISGLVSRDGLSIAPAVLNFDLWVMVAVAVACLPVFIVGYYVAYLILGAQGHDALDESSAIMIGFVLPITIVTLVAMLFRNQTRQGSSSG
jgi:cation:H+ antiporter